MVLHSLYIAKYVHSNAVSNLGSKSRKKRKLINGRDDKDMCQSALLKSIRGKNRPRMSVSCFSIIMSNPRLRFNLLGCSLTTDY